MEPLNLHSIPTHALPLAALGLLLLVAVVGRAMRRVGFTYLDVSLLLVAAPLAAGSDVVFHTTGPTTLAFNVAGFLIPALVGVKFLIEGKAPLLATVGALCIVTVVAYFSSFAVPNQGVLLYYRIPAAAAIFLALLMRWGVWHQAGPMAYVSGAGGVIFGADAFRIHELMNPDGAAHRIVIGGAGVFDGIFLVAALAAAGSLVACSFHQTIEAHLASRASRTRAPAPTRLEG